MSKGFSKAPRRFPTRIGLKEPESGVGMAELEKNKDVKPALARTPHPASNVQVGDQVRLRKPHPCGSFDWKIIRIGADIGLRCLGCDHKVMLARPIFERRFKSFLVKAGTPPGQTFKEIK